MSITLSHVWNMTVVFLLLVAHAAAASQTVRGQAAAPSEDRTNVPIKVTVAVSKPLAEVNVAKVKIGDQEVWGQLTAPGLLNDQADKIKDGVARELHLIVPKLAKGQEVSIEATIADDAKGPSETFAWKEVPKEHIDLTYAGRPVARYMMEPYDDSSGESRERTYKVFHHVFDPSGQALLTKGAGGRYTHHRGIFYGFSKCSYGDGGKKRADIWHCRGGVHQSHEGVLSQEAGPVLARHRLAVDWHGNDKEVFAKEVRELTFYNTPGGLLVEFASRLQSVDGTLKVDGDPQHAGFQFRASNDVNDKTAGQTYYIRPDGVDKPGSYKQNQQQPWNAMSFVLDDQRYTVGYLDHPENPKPGFYSERNYGRFGSYFVAEAEGDQTIDVNYRLWIQPGEMDVATVAAHAQNFTDPPQVGVK